MPSVHNIPVRVTTHFITIILSTVVSTCSDGNGSTQDPLDALSHQPPTTTADVTQEISGTNAPLIGSEFPWESKNGYVQHEYVASGIATAYKSNGPRSEDGRWTFSPLSTASYRTRILVRRPQEPEAASGTVIIEWLVVSGGVDDCPDYTTLEEEIIRQGHIWVGVSAQLISVEGGVVVVVAPGSEGIAGKGMKALDPERYSSLSHPGDGYSFDIFTQVARAVRAGGDVLGGIQPAKILAAGESQSAIALTTYYNGVQPLTRVFDGFFIHCRASVALPLVKPGRPADLIRTFVSSNGPYLIRADLEAPVLELQAEGDLVSIMNSVAVRQPNSERFHLWEVAGTAHWEVRGAAHTDTQIAGDFANGIDCGVAINKAPMHLVAKAALRSLDTWVRTGRVPPISPLIDITDATPQEIRRDSDGIALGGIRTPPVDVPVDVLSGAPGPNPDLKCLLMGSTIPLSEARIAELYPSRQIYEQQYAAAADQAIEAGFILKDDREALMAYAQPLRVAP